MLCPVHSIVVERIVIGKYYKLDVLALGAWRSGQRWGHNPCWAKDV
jgi:hypothetical protein